MKGYKATYDGKCIGLTYEVGKTYSIDKLMMCECGFHFYLDLKDIVKYFRSDKNLVVFEVEAIGECIVEDDMAVTDKLKILREIPKEEYQEWIRYDDRGNVIYFKKHDNYEKFFEYDSDGNMILEKSSNYKWHYEYDSGGNLIHEIDQQGIEKFYEYDSEGNLIYSRGPAEIEIWREYDSNGNEVHYRYSDGRPGNDYEAWNEFDSDGNMIYCKSKGVHFCSRDSSTESWFEYDSNGNVIYIKYGSNGDEYFFGYDEKGNMVSYKKLPGDFKWNVTIE